MLQKRLFLIGVFVLLLASVSLAQETPSASITNDEGGVTRVYGVLPIANPNIKVRVDVPLIILEDQSGFVARDLKLPIAPESQVVGRWVTDFYADSNPEYEILLPIVPQGTFHDVDNNGEENTGVQIYQVGFWDNTYGDITLDDREAYGWSGAYSSIKVSINPETLGEYISGKLVIFASEEGQGFPSGFGEDGKLFTEDDPIMSIPAGYSVVTIGEEPFTLDRSNAVEMNLLEPDGYAPDDFSELSYTEAFDALVEKAKKEYSFTEDKGIDWDALSAEYRPRIQEAEEAEDVDAYLIAIDEFAKAIPDGHISAASTVSAQREQEAIAGGLGFSLRELSDGRVLVIFILEDSEASQAGIGYGTEIIAIDGVAISDAITNAYSPNAPYSSAEIQRLDGVRFVTRFPLAKGTVEVTFKPADSDEEQTATLSIVGERQSLSFTRQFVYGQASPVPLAPMNWEFYPDTNYGYIKITVFDGNVDYFKKQWELFLETANAIGSPGIIVDVRQNPGGSSGIAGLLTSYLIQEPLPLPISEEYNPDIDAFFSDPNQDNNLEPTRNLNAQYTGKVVALVSPACASACEYFAYYLQSAGIDIIGTYATNGIAGGYISTLLPEGVEFSLPTSRPVDSEGNVVIEGPGVVPSIRIPVTEENMSSTEDYLLAEAIAYLDSSTAIEIVDGGAIAVGETLEGTIAPKQRVNVAFNTGEGGIVDIVMVSEAGAYVNILSTEGDVLASGTSPSDPGWEELELPPNFDLVLEIVTDADSGEGAYTLSVVAK